MSILSYRVYFVECDACGRQTTDRDSAEDAAGDARDASWKRVAINRWLCNRCAKDVS